MKILNLFQKTSTPKNMEGKSYSSAPQTLDEFLSRFSRGGKDTNHKLEPIESLNYYAAIPSVFNAVNTIAREGANIQPLVFDIKTGEVDTSAPSAKLLELLNFPNTDVSGEEFIEQTLTYLKATGNAFLIAEGRVNFNDYARSETRQLLCAPPDRIKFGAIRGVSPESIDVQMPGGEILIFERRVIQGRHRYFYKDHHEIYHIRHFNPAKYENNHFGLSPLQALRRDLDLYEASVIHNISMLLQGNKVSGIMNHEMKLTDDQQARLQQQIEEFYQGAKNAGKILGLPAGFTFTPIDMAYDMDYAKLQSTVDIKVYNNYMIPLPTVTPEKATFSNLEQSVLSLYNNAVIPAIDRFYHELTLFLMPRYRQDWKSFKLGFDENDIDALQPIRNETLKLMKEIGVNSINELRIAKGDVPAINGDSILQPSSNIPVARVPRQEEEEEAVEEDIAEELLKLTDVNGDALFSKEHIKDYINKEV